MLLNMENKHIFNVFYKQNNYISRYKNSNNNTK